MHLRNLRLLIEVVNLRFELRLTTITPAQVHRTAKFNVNVINCYHYGAREQVATSSVVYALKQLAFTDRKSKFEIRVTSDLNA